MPNLKPTKDNARHRQRARQPRKVKVEPAPLKVDVVALRAQLPNMPNKDLLSFGRKLRGLYGDNPCEELRALLLEAGLEYQRRYRKREEQR